MPTVEILSPLSETGVPPTFNVEGEDDLPRQTSKKDKKDEKKDKEEFISTTLLQSSPQIKVSYRETGSTGPWQGELEATLNDDGTWTRELTLTAGHNYDIKAVIYENGMATAEMDTVYGVQVSSTPLIWINPPPPPGPPSPAPMMLVTADNKVLRGTSAPATDVPGTIACFVIRYSGKKKRILPVARYTNTGRGNESGDWFVNPPPQLHRPQGNHKAYVLVACIEGPNGRIVASASRMLRKNH